MLEVKSDITMRVYFDTEMLKPLKHPQSACMMLCFVINITVNFLILSVFVLSSTNKIENLSI